MVRVLVMAVLVVGVARAETPAIEWRVGDAVCAQIAAAAGIGGRVEVVAASVEAHSAAAALQRALESAGLVHALLAPAPPAGGIVPSDGELVAEVHARAPAARVAIVRLDPSAAGAPAATVLLLDGESRTLATVALTSTVESPPPIAVAEPTAPPSHVRWPVSPAAVAAITDAIGAGRPVAIVAAGSGDAIEAADAVAAALIRAGEVRVEERPLFREPVDLSDENVAERVARRHRASFVAVVRVAPPHPRRAARARVVVLDRWGHTISLTTLRADDTPEETARRWNEVERLDLTSRRRAGTGLILGGALGFGALTLLNFGLADQYNNGSLAVPIVGPLAAGFGALSSASSDCSHDAFASLCGSARLIGTLVGIELIFDGVLQAAALVAAIAGLAYRFTTPDRTPTLTLAPLPRGGALSIAGRF